MADDGAGEGTHPGLEEAVRGHGSHGPHLLQGLLGQGHVALGNPGGDLRVALPGGVLDHHIALFLGQGPGHAHGLVVVQLGDRAAGALGPDALHARGRGALGHEDDGLVAQLPGRPGQAPAVVAVGGGDEGHIPDLLAGLGRAQLVARDLRHVAAQPGGEEPAHGIGSAQDLEGLEAVAGGLVLDQEVLEAEFRGQARQRREGGGLVLLERRMEAAHGSGAGGGEGGKVRALADGLAGGIGVHPDRHHDPEGNRLLKAGPCGTGGLRFPCPCPWYSKKGAKAPRK